MAEVQKKDSSDRRADSVARENATRSHSMTSECLEGDGLDTGRGVGGGSSTYRGWVTTGENAGGEGSGTRDEGEDSVIVVRKKEYAEMGAEPVYVFVGRMYGYGGDEREEALSLDADSVKSRGWKERGVVPVKHRVRDRIYDGDEAVIKALGDQIPKGRMKRWDGYAASGLWVVAFDKRLREIPLTLGNKMMHIKNGNTNPQLMSRKDRNRLAHSLNGNQAQRKMATRESIKNNAMATLGGVSDGPTIADMFKGADYPFYRAMDKVGEVDSRSFSAIPGLSPEEARVAALPLTLGAVNDGRGKGKKKAVAMSSQQHLRSPEASIKRASREKAITSGGARTEKGAAVEVDPIDRYTRGVMRLHDAKEHTPHLLEATKQDVKRDVGQGVINIFSGAYKPGDERDILPGGFIVGVDEGGLLTAIGPEAIQGDRGLADRAYEVLERVGAFVPVLGRSVGASHGRVDKEAPAPAVSVDRAAFLHDSMVTQGMDREQAWGKFFNGLSRAENVPGPVAMVSSLISNLMGASNSATAKEVEFISGGTAPDLSFWIPHTDRDVSPPLEVAIGVYPDAISDIVKEWEIVVPGGETVAEPAEKNEMPTATADVHGTAQILDNYEGQMADTTEQVDKPPSDVAGAVAGSASIDTPILVWKGFKVDTGAGSSVLTMAMWESLGAVGSVDLVEDNDIEDIAGRKIEGKRVRGVVELMGVALNGPIVLDAGSELQGGLPVLGAIDIRRLSSGGSSVLSEGVWTTAGGEVLGGVGNKASPPPVWQNGLEQTDDWFYMPDVLAAMRGFGAHVAIPYADDETRNDRYNSAQIVQSVSAKAAWYILGVTQSSINPGGQGAVSSVMPVKLWHTVIWTDVANNNSISLVIPRRPYSIVWPGRVMLAFSMTNRAKVMQSELMEDPYGNVAARAGSITRSGFTVSAMKNYASMASSLAPEQSMEIFCFNALKLAAMAFMNGEVLSGSIPWSALNFGSSGYGERSGHFTPATKVTPPTDESVTEWLLDGVTSWNASLGTNGPSTNPVVGYPGVGRAGNTDALQLAAIPGAPGGHSRTMDVIFMVGEPFGANDTVSHLPYVVPTSYIQELLRIFGRDRASMGLAFLMWALLGDSLFEVSNKYNFDDPNNGIEKASVLPAPTRITLTNPRVGGLALLLPQGQQFDPAFTRTTQVQAQAVANTCVMIQPTFGQTIYSDPPQVAPNVAGTSCDMSFNWNANEYATQNVYNANAFVASWMTEMMDPTTMQTLLSILYRAFPVRGTWEGMSELVDMGGPTFIRARATTVGNEVKDRVRSNYTPNSSAGSGGSFEFGVEGALMSATGGYGTDRNELVWLEGNNNNTFVPPRASLFIHNMKAEFFNAYALGLIDVVDPSPPGSQWGNEPVILPKTWFGQRSTLTTAVRACRLSKSIGVALAGLPISAKMYNDGGEYQSGNEALRVLASMLWKSIYGSALEWSTPSLVALLADAVSSLMYGIRHPSCSGMKNDTFLNRLFAAGPQRAAAPIAWDDGLQFGGGWDPDNAGTGTNDYLCGICPFVPDVYAYQYGCAAPLYLVPLPNNTNFKSQWNFLTEMSEAEAKAMDSLRFWPKDQQMELLAGVAPADWTAALGQIVIPGYFSPPMSGTLTRAGSSNLRKYITWSELFNSRLTCMIESSDSVYSPGDPWSPVVSFNPETREMYSRTGSAANRTTYQAAAPSPYSLLPYSAGLTNDNTNPLSGRSATMCVGLYDGGGLYRYNDSPLACWNTGGFAPEEKFFIAAMASGLADDETFTIELGLRWYQGYDMPYSLYTQVGRSNAAIRNTGVWQMGNADPLLQLLNSFSVPGGALLSAADAGSGSSSNGVTTAGTPVAASGAPVAPMADKVLARAGAGTSSGSRTVLGSVSAASGRIPDYWRMWFSNPDRLRNGAGSKSRQEGWIEYADGCWVDEKGNLRGAGWPVVPKADLKPRKLEDIESDCPYLYEGVFPSGALERVDLRGYSDDKLEETFPHHGASQKSRQIQRLHLGDVILVLREDREWVADFLSANVGGDNTMIKNALLWLETLSGRQRDLAMSWTVWRREVTAARAALKKLSSHVKGGYWPSGRPLWAAELGNLAGYQLVANAVIEEETLLSKAEDLVMGKNHSPRVGEALWPQSYAEVSREATSIPNSWEVPEPVSLEEYIRTGDWPTSGASDRGKVVVTIEERDRDGSKVEDTVKIKPHKNMLRSVLKYSDVSRSVESRPPRFDKALMKAERMKYRLVIMCALEGYLVASWLTHLTGAPYCVWKWGTLQESSDRNMERFREVYQRLGRSWAEDFDFKGMDNQPRATDLSLFSDSDKAWLADRGYDALGTTSWRNFLNTQLGERRVHVGKRKEAQGTYGILSGDRDTSRQGLGKNLTETRIAIKAVNHLLTGDWKIPDSVGEFDVGALGDDHYSLGTELESQLRLIAMEGAGATPSEDNAVYRGASEYLRKFVSREWNVEKGEREGFIQGYSARAISAITTRGPTQNDPSDDADVLGTILGAVRLTNVRSPAGSISADAVARVYCKAKGIDPEMAYVPRWAGGMGVIVGRKRYSRYTGPEPGFNPGKVTTDANSEWERDVMNGKLNELGVVATEQELVKWQEAKVNTTLVESAIAGVTAKLRRNNREQYKKRRYNELETEYRDVVIRGFDAHLDYMRDGVPRAPGAKDLYWGRWSHARGKINVLMDWGKVVGWSLKEVLDKVGVGIEGVKVVSTKLKLRQRDALDHLMGVKYWPSKWTGAGDVETVAGVFESRFFPPTIEENVVRSGKVSRWMINELYVDFWTQVESTRWWKSVIYKMRA